MLKNILTVRKKEYLFLVVILCFGAVFGTIVDYCDGVYTFNAGFALGLATVFCLFMGAAHSEYFRWMITFGRTRNEYILYTVINSIIKYILIEAIALLCLVFNEVVRNKTFPFETADIIRYAFMYIIVMMVIEIFIGTIVMRFSKKALWVMWGLWMAMCLMPQFIESALTNRPESLLARTCRYIMNISVTESKLIIAGVVIMTVMMLFNIISIKKQDVTV